MTNLNEQSTIDSFKHFLNRVIEEDLEDTEFFFIYDGREIRSSRRITTVIFPFVLRMVEHHLSAYTGNPQQNFIFSINNDRNGNMISIKGINRENPPNRILVSTAILFIYNNIFKSKAKNFDLLNYVSVINQ